MRQELRGQGRSHNWRFLFCIFENCYQLICISVWKTKRGLIKAFSLLWIRNQFVAFEWDWWISSCVCSLSPALPRQKLTEKNQAISSLKVLILFSCSQRKLRLHLVKRGQLCKMQTWWIPDMSAPKPFDQKRQHMTNFKLQTEMESCKLAEGQGLGPGHSLSPECERDSGREKALTEF